MLIPVLFTMFLAAVPAVAQENLNQAETDLGTAAVSGQMNLTVNPPARGLTFAEPVLPTSRSYYDEGLKNKVQVFSDEFTIYRPFKAQDSADTGNINISVRIDGAAG